MKRAKENGDVRARDKEKKENNVVSERREEREFLSASANEMYYRKCRYSDIITMILSLSVGFCSSVRISNLLRYLRDPLSRNPTSLSLCAPAA